MLRRLSLALLVAQAAAFAPASVRQVTSSKATTSIVSISPSIRSGDVSRHAVLEQTELPEKLYIPKEKEMPKVLGGLSIGLRKLVVVTGASSGLGLAAATTLAKTGRYFVVMACRDVEKAKRGTFCSVVVWFLISRVLIGS